MEQKKIPLLFLLFVVFFVFLSKDYERALTRASINFPGLDFSPTEQKINFTVSSAIPPKISIFHGDTEIKNIAIYVSNQENFQPASLIASMAGVVGYEVELERSSAFKPGKYTIKIGKSTKEFWWGVMAINSNKSVYQKGDKARLMMTLLDDGGRTVCGNYLEAKVISPSGVETNFSTEAKSIEISPECGSFAVDTPPDYESSYIVDELGEYKIIARSLLFPGSSKEHEISSNFTVGGPFIIERIGPTRIYPPNHYQVKINITSAYESWEGNIMETVPDVFAISCDNCKMSVNKNTTLTDGAPAESQLEPQSSNLTLDSSVANKKDLSRGKSFLLRGPTGNRTPETPVSSWSSAPAQAHKSTVLRWHTKIKKNETKTIIYTFKAPNISPEFYLLGPLTFMESQTEVGPGVFSFEEPRQWQIAADATVTWDNGGGNGLWGTATNWSGDALPGAGDVATFNNTTTTNTFVNVSSTLNGLSIASTYTGTITMATSTPLPQFTIGGSGFSQSGGTLAMNNGVMQVGGVFSQTGSSILNASGTILLNATSSQTFTPSSTLPNLIINDGLVGYWKLDETSLNNSSSVTDYSGYGNTGTATNMGAGSGPSSTVASTIKFNNPRSFNFDGTDDYVDIGSTNNGTVHTVAFWMDYRDGGDGVVIGGDDNIYACYIDGPNSSTHAIYYNQNGFVSVIHGGFTSGTWYHIAIVRNGTSVSFYKNGAQIGTTQTLSANNAQTLKYFGQEAAPGTFSFTGLIDDVRIYNRALTPAEIVALALGNQPATSYAGNAQTLASALTVNGDLTLNSGWLDASSSNITVSGSWLNHGGLFNSRSNTVTLNGTASNKEILSGGQTFGNLTINGSGGTYFLDDRMYTSGTLTLTAGTLNAATGTNAFKLHAGNISQTGGFFTASSGTVIIDGTGSSTLTVSSTLNNLQIESTRESGLVGYWKFDEGNSTSTRDWSGNGNTGTFVSTSTSPTATSTVTSTIAFDNPYSLSFDGTDDYVSIPNTISSVKTVSFWTNTTSSNSSFIDLNGTAGINATGTTVSASGFTSPTIYVNGINTTTRTTSTWQHIVVTTDTGISASVISIGRIGSTYVPGLLDDVRIYNRALTAAEVAELARGRYSRGGPANATSSPTFTLGAPLTISGSSTIFNGNLDVSGSNYGITLTGNWANYSTSTAFVGRSGTLTLNGTNQTIFGTSTFASLTKTVSVARTLTFEASGTQTFTGALTLNGAASNLLSIRSSITGTKAKIDPQGTRNATYLDVKDSNNINSVAISCSDCTNSDNNTNWSFGGAASSSGGGAVEGGGGGSQLGGGNDGGGGAPAGGEGSGGGSQQSGGGGQGGGDGGSSSVLATMGWIFKAVMEWILDLFGKIVRYFY